MSTFLATLLIFGTVMAVMSIGVIFRRKPLQGSCGGLAAIGLDQCEFCEGDPEKCETKRQGKKEPELLQL